MAQQTKANDSTELKSTVKVRWTGYARDRLAEYAVDLAQDDDDTRWTHIQAALGRQKTNVVLETVEEAEALASELGDLQMGRPWTNSSIERAARRVQGEITEDLAEQGYTAEYSSGFFRGYEQEDEQPEVRTDGGVASNDPELVAADEQEAIDSLQVHLTRDEMRDACRAWDLDGYSGTKGEMAQAMVEQALGRVIGLLMEEGVDIRGDLAEAAGLTEDGDDEADEAEQEQEDEDDDSQPVGSLAGDLLERDPADYGYTAKLQMTEKQTAAIVAALENPEATQGEVAEAADCTERYANSTLNRWRGTEDEVEAAEDAGADVPPEYRDVAPEDA